MTINEIRDELALLSQVNPLEGQRYATCLDTYEAASNQRELILGWFRDNVIPNLSTEHASFLSIGCGAGDLDEQILTAGRSHASAISYVGLEPDPRQCDRFMSRMVFENDRNIRVEAHNARFEDFNEQNRFDLVLMVHSLYYVDDPASTLQNALDLVDDFGQLVILIASNDTLNELSSSFWELEDGDSTWFSEDLSRHLETLGLSFERRRIEATLDVTPCFEPDSEQGTHIADFLAQAHTGELPAHLRQMIFRYLDATARRDGDMRWLPHNVDAFTIKRSAASQLRRSA